MQPRRGLMKVLVPTARGHTGDVAGIPQVGDEVYEAATHLHPGPVRALIERYGLALDPDRPKRPPALEEPVPHFNFAPLKNAVARLLAAADIYAAASANNPTTSAEINRLLFTSERLLTREAGLEGRPWYKHFLYAPGFYTGYGVKTIPGVREAIEQRQYDAVDPQIVLAADVLNRLAGRVEELGRLVGGGG